MDSLEFWQSVYGWEDEHKFDNSLNDRIDGNRINQWMDEWMEGLAQCDTGHAVIREKNQ